jgi:hypothetical protein
MKQNEMNRILKEELQHISDSKRGHQKDFRMVYNIVRRRDLAQNPASPRRESFLKCIETMGQTSTDFNPLDLDFDSNFFGPVDLDKMRPLESVDRDRISYIIERDKILGKWELFAKRNGLELAWFCDLISRADTVIKNKGACPCLPRERPHCPCPEAIEECQHKGECNCRVFLVKDWGQRWKAKQVV